MSEHPLTKIEESYAYRLGRINRLLRRRLISVTMRVDPALSPEQYVLIMRLAREDGVHQNELVDPDLDDRPNITRQIKGLLNRKLVRVASDPKDRRRKCLFLTTEGRELAERFVPHVREHRHALFGSLPTEDLEAFDRVLSHLEDSLS